MRVKSLLYIYIGFTIISGISEKQLKKSETVCGCGMYAHTVPDFSVNTGLNPVLTVQSSAFNKQRQFEELLSFSRRLNSY